MIPVTKTYLPKKEIYQKYIDEIWERRWLTNHGPLVLELEEKLREYFGVKHVFLTNNGTIALQIAIKALGLKKEIITTPFSYVATTSSIVWEGCKPVFADIYNDSFTINVEAIEKEITQDTEAILATHVFGNPCEIDKIEKIALKYNLKILYDAAHCFGVKYKDKSVLNYGDVSTISFHATKLFHTIEGGAIATNDDGIAHKIEYMRNFGHKGQEDFWGMGINGKTSEFNAAMGLAILPDINIIINSRKLIIERYMHHLGTIKELKFIKLISNTVYNYAYFPVVFENEKSAIEVQKFLNSFNIYPRRYFYPSLNKLPYIPYQKLEISESIASRILCLPLYVDLDLVNVDRICTYIIQIIKYKS